MFMKQVVDYLNTVLKADDSIIIGCSGGSDSMCLLYLMKQYFSNCNIVCAHINHKVRKQSDKEYKYVKSFCEKNNFVFEGMEIPQVINNNFEARARQIRYEFYTALQKKYNAKYIMTAHHGDDLIETILMRLSRGSNLSGYAGIKIIDENYLRPLLLVNKNQILKYVKENKIKYYEDYTNHQNKHTRNRYRHKILPFLKKENSNVNKKYLKFSNELLEYDKFVVDYIKETNVIKDKKINIKKFLCQSEFIQKKIIELLIEDIQKNSIFDVKDQNVKSVINIIKSSKSNSIVNLPNNYVGKKCYDTFSIEKVQEYNDYEVPFINIFEDSKWIISKIKQTKEKSNYVLRLDSNEIKLPLIIRNRRDGDSMVVKNLGRKKIKNIFIDEKLSIEERNSQPLIVDSNNEILWIPGIKKSEFDKDKEEKYDIILYSERKRTNE